MHEHKHIPPSLHTCERIRLAEGNLATVDQCSCGMLHLHLGAITLRVSPEALRSIFETLGESIAAQAVLKHEALRPNTSLHS